MDKHQKNIDKYKAKFKALFEYKYYADSYLKEADADPAADDAATVDLGAPAAEGGEDPASAGADPTAAAGGTETGAAADPAAAGGDAAAATGGAGAETAGAEDPTATAGMDASAGFPAGGGGATAGTDPAADLAAAGADPAAAEGGDGEDVEVDVTDIIKKSDNIEKLTHQSEEKISALYQKFDELSSKLNNMGGILDTVDDLKREIIKRNPTPNEKLQMVSYKSEPFGQKIDDYFSSHPGGYDIEPLKLGQNPNPTNISDISVKKTELEDNGPDEPKMYKLSLKDIYDSYNEANAKKLK